MSSSKSQSRNPDFKKDDAPPKKPILESVRVWEHSKGDGNCSRRNKPVYTPPNEIPNSCGSTKKGYDPSGCGASDWRSKGLRIRDKETKQVLDK